MAGPNGAARNAAVALLAAESGGFNATLAPILAANNIKPLTVSFAKGSTSFFQGYIEVDSEVIDYSQLDPKPIGIAIYTTGAVNSKDTNASLFSGLVELRIDVYLRLRARNENSEGVEADDTDTVLDCVEEAIMRVLTAPDNWKSSTPEDPIGVIYNNDWKSDRSPILMFEDGYQQRVGISLAVGVRI